MTLIADNLSYQYIIKTLAPKTQVNLPLLKHFVDKNW